MPINGLLRGILLLIAAALLWPGGLWLHLGGAMAFAGVFWLNRRRGSRAAVTV